MKPRPIKMMRLIALLKANPNIKLRSNDLARELKMTHKDFQTFCRTDEVLAQVNVISGMNSTSLLSLKDNVAKPRVSTKAMTSTYEFSREMKANLERCEKRSFINLVSNASN